jgi:glucan phosphoethanolaminetransferase (alkaline phosphatase superfamily)
MGTRDRLRAQKRGGETYDELLLKMLEQYDPDEHQ